MNTPIVVAQANSGGSTTGTGSVRNIKVTKPSNEQAVTIQLGYDQAYKLDLSSISNEKITLVHIGEKLIILFENKSTVTVEPFFDSMNAPLSNVTVEANGRDFTGSEFASSFPITTDQSVLTAAGVSAAGAPSSGADFHGPSVDPLNEPRPLDLLGQEELPNWTTAPQLGFNALETTTSPFVDTTPPTVAAGVFTANEKGLPGQGEGGSGRVGSGEIADNNAFNNSDPSETTAGALSFSDSDGTAHISMVNGTPVTTDGTVIVGAHGVLTINLDGTFTYTLIGNDPNHTSQGTGSDGQADVFTYTVEDSSGNTQSSTLTIDILDDVPTARPDTDTIAAGETVINGNVINGFGTNEGSNGTGHDTQGADGASVTGVVAGTNATPITGGAGLGGIAGSFGTLTLHADGSYDYARTPGTAGGGSDVFTYTLTDGDGDTSVTTLTINVGDSAPTLHVPSLQEPGTSVSEAGLPVRGAEPAGSASASNSEITSGTITFTSLDGVSSVQIGGVAVTPGTLPQTISSDATGTLVVTGYSFNTVTGVGSVNYTYTLTDNTLADPSTVSFGVAVTDADNDTVSSTLTIAIVDDAPLAVNDTDTLSNITHTAAGNVITAVGTTNAGADTQGADGAHVSSIQSNNGGSGLTSVGGGVTINGQFGTLTIGADGEYTYTRSGTTPLTATETFTYSLTDGDGDTSSATLTININDNGVTITNLTAKADGGDVSVNEDDLLASRGVNESAGSDATKESTTQTGTFNVSAPDGLDSLSVGGHAVITGGVFSATSFATTLGNTLSITGFNTATGEITYSYTLLDNESHPAVNGANSLFEDFAVVVKDIDGSTAGDTLSVNIIDDVPTAVNDTDILSNITHTAAGNVITAVGTTNAGADTLGADGATVSAISSNNPGGSGLTSVGGGVTINGQFGTLTIGADGEYTYARSATTPLTATETFTYTLKDSDGDTSTANLTININDGGVGITNLTPKSAGGDVSVNEDDLLASRGAGESAGSDTSKESTTQTGTFNVSAPDGLGSLTVDGHTVISGGAFAATSFTTTLGNTLSFIGFNAGTGEVTYTYALLDNETHATGGGANSVFEDFAVVLKDIDGTTATDTLSVNIIDDVPTAVADTDSVAANKFTAETGNVITAVGTTNAGADTLGADGAVVSGVAAGNTNVNLDSASTVNTVIQGTYGKLTLQANGSYSYVRDAGTAGGVSDVFTYTLKDGDGDMSHTTLTLAIGNSTPTDTIPAAGGATTTVSESGLAARGAESAGSNSAANTETTSGTISFTSPDGLSVASLGGHALTGAPQTFTDATGSLTASYTYNAGTGTGSISYSYTLLDNTSGDNTTASFAVVVTDADGGSAPTGNLVINIVDDVPTAHADTDSVAANKFTAETGNVITAVGTTNAGADTLGADSAVVAGVAAGNTNVNLNNAGTVNTVIQGTYGKLTLQADGSYSYVRDAGTAGGNSDVFTYTLRDSDGDMSHTTLTISIGDSNPTDSIPAAGGATTTVFESGLPARGAESAGSNSAANTETTSGTISFTSPDGLSVVSLGGHALSGVPQSFPTATGSLTASYTYNAGTGTGSISYSYTLLDNTLVDPSNVSFAVVVTDADGDSAAAGNLVINIIDDVPTAVADTDSVAANKFTAETGNVITAVGTTNAGADTLGADGAVVAGVAAGNTNVNLNNAGTVNTVIQGTYGKLTLQTNGSYSYARDAGTAGGNSDVFTYTLRDGDGDMSHTTLTISIGDSTPSDTIPAAGGATTTVFEKGLPVHGGLPAGSGEMGDGNGTNNSDTSETTSGTIAITSPDGLSAVSLGGHALTGAPQTFTDATGSLTASYTFNSSTGTGTINYSYTLLTNTSGDNTSVSFGVALTDLDGDNAPAGNLVINIVDDVPSANLVIKSLVPAGHDTNLMLVLDVSGSMADPSGLTGLTRLDVLKASVTELLNQYADLGNVRVQIVSFSSDASQAGSNWMTVAQAKAAVAGLAAGGSTDYDAAVASAETLYPAAGKLATAGVQNISYFMSDGVPNESNGTGSNGIVGGEITAWQNFLTTNSIVSFSLGIGTGSTQSALDPLAYNGVTHTDTNAIIVTDPSQLTQTLVGTVSGTGGNILTDGNLPGSFGADGGHVQSITVDGTVYTYNPAAGGSISVSNGADHGSFDTTTNTETVTLASGGVLTMIMDNGTYTYTAPANVPSGFTDTIPFVLVDNDGDVAGNNLQIVVSTQDHAPIVRDDHVITNVPSASGADQISVPDYALLYNDSDPEGQTITITGVSGATDGTAVHSSSVVTFTEESNGATDGGTFNYTGSANGLTNTATVTVDRAQANENTLDGTGLGDVLIGRDGNGSTINGNEGNDVLIGGNQGDVLNGGTGDDLMVGGAGKDTMTGGTGKDIFVFTATSDSATTSGNADVITDFVHGQDIIDLSAIDSNSGVAGDQAFTFNGTTPTARGVWFTETGGNTVISIDTNGNSASAEMMIVLTGINKGLTAADFHL